MIHGKIEWSFQPGDCYKRVFQFVGEIGVEAGQVSLTVGTIKRKKVVQLITTKISGGHWMGFGVVHYSDPDGTR